MVSAKSFKTPPRTRTGDGNPRRLGVEIEYVGVDAAHSARIVADLYGGTIEAIGAHWFDVTGTRLGDFLVELDLQYAHARDTGTEAPDKLRETEARLREAFGDVSKAIVPTEIVAPPIPWDKAAELEALISELREAGAMGTDQSFLYAFGLQLNPELPSLKVLDILRYLQAYIVLSPQLHEEISVDFTRRMLPYVDRFPDAYVRLVLDPAYAPDQDRLIDDYLDHNPTRNRELDMLPLFAHLDDDRVKSRLDDPLIKARPTFHYRLPNSNIADPDWGIGVEWARWVRVEELAEDEGALRDLAEARRKDAEGFAQNLLDRLSTWMES